MAGMRSLEQRVAALEEAVDRLTHPEPAILKECRIDVFRDGLQGGAVRITHLPSGITAEGQATAGDIKDLSRELAADLAQALAEDDSTAART